MIWGQRWRRAAGGGRRHEDEAGRVLDELEPSLASVVEPCSGMEAEAVELLPAPRS
jgi:hypothetical protein